jgi:hypothetical protein
MYARWPARVKHPPASGSGGGTAPEETTLRAPEQDRDDGQEERRDFRERTEPLDARKLVFTDETGVDTRLVRRWARACNGARARGSAPSGSWERLTALGAPGAEGR